MAIRIVKSITKDNTATAVRVVLEHDTEFPEWVNVKIAAPDHKSWVLSFPVEEVRALLDGA